MNNINLALSGGGIKGVAHIGILKCLEENNIRVKSISGCSSGSIIAVLYALGYSSDEIYSIVKYNLNYIIKNGFNFGLQSILLWKKKMGLNNGNIIENILNKVLKEKNIFNIEEIKMPIYISTVDINTGKTIYFTNIKNKYRKYDDNEKYINTGKISEIVRASCSYPGIFSPKQIGTNLLVDGGIRDNIPVIPFVRNEIGDTVAIMFNNNKIKNVNNIFDVIMQSFEILSHDNNFESSKLADIKVEIQLEDVKLLDYSKFDYVYNEGYNQAKKILNNNIY